VEETAEESYRAAIAAAVALEKDGADTVVIEAGDSFDLDAAITKAEQVGPSWLIEIPVFGAVLEHLAKLAGVSVFHVDDVPGSLFATTEKLAPGKSSVIVADGVIGVPAPEKAPDQQDEPSGPRVTKLLKTAEERFVLGIVLVPEERDSQGDIYSHDEVRKAAHEYMEKAGHLGKQHSEIVTGKLKILETFVAPAEFTQDEVTIAKGTWLMGIRVVDDELWSDVKKGAFTGFSIGGAAHRAPEQAA
jgi:hypothetical protein